MKWVDRLVGFIIGVAILYSVGYVGSLNTRISGIEQFLNKAISQQNQAQQTQRPPEIKK